MKKTTLMILIVLLSIPAFLFAGGAEEAVVDVEAATGETTFEGVLDINRSQGWEIGRKGGRYVRAQLGDPKSFNPIIAEETSTTDVTAVIFDGLATRSQFNLEWEPELAESWEISDDGKSITYTLRRGLTWSDGEPITAKDFVFTANQLYLREDVSGSTRGIWTQETEDGTPQMVDFTYVDSRRIRVTFPQVNAGILDQSSFGAVPMHIFAPVIGWDEDEHGLDYEYTVETNEDGVDVVVEVKDEGVDYAAVNSFWGVDTDVTQIVGSGPWVIDGYVPDQRIVFSANELYWNTDANGTQLPYLEEMVYVTIPDQDTMLQRFLAGDLDSYGLRGEDYGVLVDQQEELGIRLFSLGPDSGTTFITFNQNPIEGDDDAGIEAPQLTWLSNKTFRQAMAHLVDRETMINNIAFGFGYPQYSFIPTFSPYYWNGAPDAAFPYDPQTAADMLDSIDYIDRDGDGWREDPDGNRITLNMSTNSGNTQREAVGELFKQEAAAVGIEIDFTPKDFNALVTQLVSTYDWELIIIGLTGGVDPISGGNVYPSDGSLHMIEPNQTAPRRDWEREVDEAWIRANFTTDEQQRVDNFRIIQRLWIEEVPWVFTFNTAVLGAMKAEFGNYFPQPIRDYDLARQAEYLYIK